MKKILMLGIALAATSFSLADIISKDPIMCTADYSPVCAQQTIYCFAAPCLQPEPKTYSNSCQADAQGAKILYKGKCESSSDSVSNSYIGIRVKKLQQNLLNYQNINNLTNQQIKDILKSGVEKVDNILMTSRLFPSALAKYTLQKKVYQQTLNIFSN